MTPGTLTPISNSITALAVGSGIVLFTPDTQRLICITMNRKAAVAGGIEALAARAIDTGDTEEALEHIVNLAAELREELLNLANLAGQIVASKAA